MGVLTKDGGRDVPFNKMLLRTVLSVRSPFLNFVVFHYCPFAVRILAGLTQEYFSLQISLQEGRVPVSSVVLLINCTHTRESRLMDLKASWVMVARVKRSIDELIQN